MKSSTLFIKGINYYYRVKRERWLKQLRKRNHNHDFSLISNDCTGGVICHDLGEQFRSPTVNLWIPNPQFLTFAQNLQYYLSCEMRETPDATKTYPVGTIIPKDKDHIPIEVNFEHYPSFAAGYAKWKERSLRVNYDRLYYVWHYFGENADEDVRAFDRWEARKLIILHAPMEGLKSYKAVSCYRSNPYHGKILSVIRETGKRYLDEINYTDFLSMK